MPNPTTRAEEFTFTCEGNLLKAYGAWLPKHERSPAVVLVHDVRGLSEHYQDLTRRLAAEGFFALALDLYCRDGAPKLPTLESVFSWMQQLDDRRVLRDIDAAVRFLGSRLDVRASSIGIMGFCMGGQYALMAACAVSGFAACVSFYGMLRYAEKTEIKPRDPLDLAPKLSCPWLGLFGDEDALIPRADVKELESLLRKNGKTFQTKIYQGAGHAFLNDTRPDAYRPEAARDAWERAMTFLRTHLS
ncbi:MAG TPA: dienelactone hydrolase family protein [Candidatus Acidoferrales bacterium]|nr:dienelactone hydrolase family protein [Candidatus Acidoferrales bacterium]